MGGVGTIAIEAVWYRNQNTPNSSLKPQTTSGLWNFSFGVSGIWVHLPPNLQPQFVEASYPGRACAGLWVFFAHGFLRTVSSAIRWENDIRVVLLIAVPFFVTTIVRHPYIKRTPRDYLLPIRIQGVMSAPDESGPYPHGPSHEDTSLLFGVGGHVSGVF